jgi:hypothetical protein
MAEIPHPLTPGPPWPEDFGEVILVFGDGSKQAFENCWRPKYLRYQGMVFERHPLGTIRLPTQPVSKPVYYFVGPENSSKVFDLLIRRSEEAHEPKW